MQLLMRRPEVDGFICVAALSQPFTIFNFLAPCPSSGLLVNGELDRVVPTSSVAGNVGEDEGPARHQDRDEVIPGANHFFENKTEELGDVVGKYLDERMIQFEQDREQQERERERERERQRQRELERMEAQSAPAPSSGGGGDDDGDDE